MRHAALIGSTLAVSAWCITRGSGSLELQGCVLAVALAAGGLAHGALDDHVAKRRWGWGRPAFIAAYLGVSTAMVLVLSLDLVVGSVFFGLASAWHFGEADMRRLGVEGPELVPASLARGALVVGCLAAAHPEVTAPWLAPLDLEVTGQLSGLPLVLGLVGVHTGILAVACKGPGRELAVADGVVLGLLFGLVEPVLAFAWYFAVWHSAEHLGQLKRRVFHKESGWGVLLRAMPFTLISAMGLVLIGVVGRTLAPSMPLPTLFLLGLAPLAVPHVGLVEGWRRTWNGGD